MRGIYIVNNFLFNRAELNFYHLYKIEIESILRHDLYLVLVWVPNLEHRNSLDNVILHHQDE